MKSKPIYMNGMTCLNCGIGQYDGYYTDLTDKRKIVWTKPCSNCGDIRRSMMNKKVFLRKVLERDRKVTHILRKGEHNGHN